MKQELNNKQIDKLLNIYFTKEKREAKGNILEHKLRKTLQKQMIFHRIKRFTIPVAAIVLLSLGIAYYSFYNKLFKKTEIPQSQIIYQDDDFMIYIQE